jgi:hypothetical protein
LRDREAPLCIAEAKNDLKVPFAGDRELGLFAVAAARLRPGGIQDVGKTVAGTGLAGCVRDVYYYLKLLLELAACFPIRPIRPVRLIPTP